jgi:hypothetical protein
MHQLGVPENTCYHVKYYLYFISVINAMHVDVGSRDSIAYVTAAVDKSFRRLHNIKSESD